jgi:hypothetical protein
VILTPIVLRNGVRLGYVFLVNYPMMLSALWRMIKPLLDPKTAAKIQFVDLPVLKDYFEESNLLIEHGGTSTFQPSGLSIGLETCVPQSEATDEHK